MFPKNTRLIFSFRKIGNGPGTIKFGILSFGIHFMKFSTLKADMASRRGEVGLGHPRNRRGEDGVASKLSFRGEDCCDLILASTVSRMTQTRPRLIRYLVTLASPRKINGILVYPREDCL